MSGQTWTVDPAGVEEVATSDGVEAHLADIAGQLESRLNATASSLTRKSWKAQGHTVITTSSFWHWEEFGTRRLAPRAPVRASMTALGIGKIDMDPPG